MAVDIDDVALGGFEVSAVVLGAPGSDEAAVQLVMALTALDVSCRVWDEPFGEPPAATLLVGCGASATAALAAAMRYPTHWRGIVALSPQLPEPAPAWKVRLRQALGCASPMSRALNELRGPWTRLGAPVTLIHGSGAPDIMRARRAAQRTPTWVRLSEVASPLPSPGDPEVVRVLLGAKEQAAEVLEALSS